ncbi:hypothetical protein Q3G72_017289 [Acer saccharum]|nr:hypothetical protein Q3G72_017289 [Acer saccharum]
MVHDSGNSGNLGKEEGGGGKRRLWGGERESASKSRVAALNEIESAAKEVERSRNIVRRQRKDLRARMLEVSREEAERKRMLDERANYSINSSTANSEKEAVYSTVKGNKLADDFILIEATRERNIRKACESLAAHILDKISFSFPAYEGSGIHSNPQLEAAKLGSDFEGEIPDEVRTVIVNCLKSPPQLLQAITGYTLRLKTMISREIEKIDVRADAETLRYKYENNTVMDVFS